MYYMCVCMYVGKTVFRKNEIKIQCESKRFLLENLNHLLEKTQKLEKLDSNLVWTMSNRFGSRAKAFFSQNSSLL